MSIYLLIFQILSKRTLSINGKNAKIVSFELNTWPAYILEKDYYPGWRPAAKDELLLFAKKYKPAIWFPPVYGIDPEINPSMFGPLAKVYGAKKEKVEQVTYNPIRGLQAGSLFLFIEDKDA